jgi:hypothetical protein
LVFTPDRVVNFLAVHGNDLGCLDPQANFVATDVHDGYDYIIANHDAFISMAGKN